MFEDIVGHESIRAYLQRAIGNKTMPHTLLFSGLEGIGKKTLAYALSAHLLQSPLERLVSGRHPDFHLLTPEGKSGLHSIESIREAIQESQETPFEAPVQCFIFDCAERMQAPSANALLKTIEEPPPNTYWILITSNRDALLPTIRSRCTQLLFHPLPEAEVAAILERLQVPTQFARFGQGSVSAALEFHAHPEVSEAEKLLLTLFSSQPSYPTFLQTLEKVDSLLEHEEPLLYHRRVSRLFATLSLHFRDSILREIDPHSSLLYFSRAESFTPPSDWEVALEKAQLGFSRNLKLTTCLESLIM